jgi:hypothetical protein
MLAQVYLYNIPFETEIVSAHGTRTLDGVICSYLHIGKFMVQELSGLINPFIRWRFATLPATVHPIVV